MLADFGFGVLVVTLAIAIYGITSALIGARKNSLVWVESARMAMLLTWPLLSVAALSLIVLLVTGHYELQFAYNVTSNSMPFYLKVTGLWGGQSGSLVFWSWLMAAFASAVTLRNWERDREFLPWVIVVSLVTLAFFVGMAIFIDNPFERFWQLPDGSQVTAMIASPGATLIFPPDGRGLNPLLNHPGMIIHPPMLYLGFVSFVIPFAFAIAALVTGRTDDRWIRVTRRWTMVAWFFLSMGLLLGMRWAYDVLGWGGFWGWDPVEVAALMPWLAGTAFLHSVMIQEKKGMFKRWNMILIVLTYSLVIYGTFLTRSGVLDSVHAFAQSAVGPAFFAFIGVTFVVSLGLLLYRWPALASEDLRSSLLSREALFLLNNLLFMGILAVCFWGINYPLISELFTGQKVTVGPPWYQSIVGPLFAALILLMGIAPLSAWGYASVRTLGKLIWRPLAAAVLVEGLILVSGVRNGGALLGFWLVALVIFVTLYEFWRGALARHRRWGESLPVALWKLAEHNRRRYGGYVIHLGIVLVALGIIGITFFQQETQGTIAQGQSLAIGPYTVTYRSLAEFQPGDGRDVARAVVSVTRTGQPLGELYPRRDYYFDAQQPVTIPGLRSTMEDDLYIVLVDWLPISSQGATFKIFVNPLVSWIWLGGLVLMLGTLLAAWPDREPASERVWLKAKTASIASD
jgi:cytochrome c-type biogenesis protein CcmF